MATAHTDGDGARVGGLKLVKATSTQGTARGPGKLTITLEAPKEEISTGPYTLNDVLAAINSHQEGTQPVVMRVLMPTNVEPDLARLEDDEEEGA